MSFAARVPRLAVIAFMAAAVTFSISGLINPPATHAATTAQTQTTNQRARIVRIAESFVGSAQYRFGAESTDYTDCSGLVWRVYKEAGLEAKIGGSRKGAKAYYYWFKRRGLASRTNPKPGDLVVWHRGGHIGIYVGNGYAVSALNEKMDVRKHKVNWLSGFTAYLHVQLTGATGSTDSGATTDSGTTTSDYLFKLTSEVNGLNVRSGPGEKYDRVATVDRGAIIRVTDKAYDGQGRKWFKGKLSNGSVGWVLAEYVTKV
jgi:cell wall-associated NlpC family hydrolase